MNNKDIKEDVFKAPHLRPSKFIVRYMEGLSNLTRKYPKISTLLFTILSIASIFGIVLSWITLKWFIAIGINLICTITFLICVISILLQRYFIGYKVRYNEHEYESIQKVTYKGIQAQASLVCEDGYMPKLNIIANSSKDAGFIEGYVLGPQIDKAFARLSLAFPFLRFLGIPSSNKQKYKYLSQLEQKMPTRYIEEMRAKIDGFKVWQDEAKLNKTKLLYKNELSYEDYFLLQLLPDFHHYNPFKPIDNNDKVINHLNMGCTTAVIRLGKYLSVLRVLDWPSYGLAGRKMIEIERNIKGYKTTTDISMSVLSGALTVLNENNMLVEMNVSRSCVSSKIRGMPAVFYNRFIAEECTSIGEVRKLINGEHQPLTAYHITVCDGKEAISIHTYQCKQNKSKHDIESLLPVVDYKIEKFPYLVIPNKGVIWNKDSNGEDIFTSTNHHDSCERQENIQAYLKTKSVEQQLLEISQSSLEGQFKYDLNNIHSIFLNIARLPLINTYESVICATYIYYEGDLVYSTAATDNGKAAQRDISHHYLLKGVEGS